jgi:hypothetical protein
MTAPDLSGPFIDLLAAAPRGPKRDGLFATWLTTRVALDLRLDPPLPPRLVRRRIDALERRLSSLTLPPPLRRALPAALALLREADDRSPALALQQMVAPVRDVLGPEAAEALARAARAARG